MNHRGVLSSYWSQNTFIYQAQNKLLKQIMTKKKNHGLCFEKQIKHDLFSYRLVWLKPRVPCSRCSRGPRLMHSGLRMCNYCRIPPFVWSFPLCPDWYAVSYWAPTKRNTVDTVQPRNGRFNSFEIPEHQRWLHHCSLQAIWGWFVANAVSKCGFQLK